MYVPVRRPLRRRGRPCPRDRTDPGLASVTGLDWLAPIATQGVDMSVKLNDTQLVLLSAASQREDHYLTLPSGTRLAPARKAANKLLAAGFVREVRARGDAPLWHRDEETERAYALKLTAAGLKAIAADTEDSVDTPRREPNGDIGETALTSDAHQAVHGEQSLELEAPAASPVAPRSGTKIDDVVKMLSGTVTLRCREREASATQELSGLCDRVPPRGHRRGAKRTVGLG